MKVVKVISILLLTGLLVGCALMGADPSQLQSSAETRAASDLDANAVMWRFTRGFMSSRDLPAGWGHRYDGVVDDYGGIGRLVTYYGDDPDRQSLVSVNQTIVIFPSDDEAKALYQAEIPKTFPPAHAEEWEQPVELAPLRYADDSRLECSIPLRLNDRPTVACRVLARYGDMVTMISAFVFQDRWITLPEFAFLVARIDDHMQSAREP